MNLAAASLLAEWDRQYADLKAQAETRRRNGMLDSAALLRTQAATIKQCADALRTLVEAPAVPDQASTESCGDINCDGRCHLR